jgi:class 3 adenylate cyclase/tetratricopeptide (TPR) repeat protein
MSSLSAFLPIDRRHALAAGHSLPDRITGAALFADISGFTPLTAVLAEELGPQRGAEELSHQLNRVFTDLIAEVHRYGGSVITFSGDAITCWFDANLASEQAPADLALSCALNMQQVMAGMAKITTVRGSHISLALKVAIATGPARRFLVGISERQTIEVLAGTTLDQMAAAESAANKGEVVVTTDTLNELGKKPLIRERRTAANGYRVAVIDKATQSHPAPFQFTPPDLPTDAAKTWLLPPVYARLKSGHAEFLAELRPAVALFVKFTGIDYDGDDEAGTKLDVFVHQTQTILERYDGYLLQITMGDKGSYFYISFGAPIAHENDAVRAAHAALELHKLADTLDYVQPLQIGINQGMAFSGAIGSSTRRTFGVIGSYVNISARLMTTAVVGQTLVSEPVATALSNEFSLLELPPVKLKGVAGKFPIWALQGRQVAAAPVLFGLSNAPMVGRDAEMEQIQALLDRLANGRSGILLIEGAAGIGKSRLVQELMGLVDLTQTALYIGSGNAIEQNTLYRAWQPVFEKIFDLPAHTDEMKADTSWQAQILNQLGPDARQYAPLLNPVLPLDLPDNDLTSQMTGEVRQENTLQLLTDVLKTAVSEQPLLLIIEDTHWLDSASWALIRRVQNQLQPLLLVLVSRPFTDMVPPVYADLRDMVSTKFIQLDALPLKDIDSLLCQRLGIDKLPKPVSDLIHNKAEGHPFFSEELAYALRDSGLIEIEDGTCRLGAAIEDFNALDFPDTIQGVITSRIDQLTPDQQLTLKVASVIGRIFAYRLLYDIYPSVEQQQVDILRELDLLEKLEITPMESPEPNLAYIFKHIVTQEVAYSLMTFAQRQQLHQKTAVWYEEIQESDLIRHYPLLAHHWHKADNIEKAVDYYGKAGENAFFNYANLEAIRFLTQAIDLDDGETSPFLKASWERQIGEAAYRLTFMEQSEAHYQAALKLTGQPMPNSTFATGGQLAGQLIRQGFHRWFPRRFVAAASSEMDKAALLETARAYEGISEIYYNKGDFLSSFLCVMKAFNLAEKAGPSPELVRGYANMCATLGTISFNGMAENYRLRAVDMAEEIGDLPAKAWSRIALSSYSLWIGAWERAEQEMNEALDIYSQISDWRKWCVAAWSLPQVIQSKGNLERARQSWAEVYDVAQRSGDTRHQVRSRGGQMFNYLSMGLIDEAFICVDAAGIVLDENPEMLPVEERLWFGMNAMKCLYEENWVEARALAHEQIAAIGRAPLKFDLQDVFAASAEILLALWGRGEATQKEAQQGIKVLNGYARSYAFARPRATRLQARYAWFSGNEGKAEKLWQKSLSQADSLSMPYEKALTLNCIGHFLKNEDYLHQANVLFEQVGGMPLLI